MSGYETVRRIRQAPGGDEVFIVAVTASIMKEEKEKVLRLGFNDCIQKPYRESEIFAAIEPCGIEYVYDIGDEPVTGTDELPEPAADIPQELAARIRQAAAVADIELLSELVRQVEGYNPRLAREFSEQLSRFDYDALIEAIP